MSESDPQSGAGQREIAYRLFATEFDDADCSYSESDEERAPNYVVTPTGGRVNRLFAVGVLTEVEAVSDDVLRGRIVDQTGPFVVYAGQYQPDARTLLERTDPPAFVAVTGKARTFEPDDGDRVYTSVRPETLSEVDADTRDRFTVRAAEMTLHRIGVMADALARDERGDDLRAALVTEGVDEGLAAGVALAIEHYGTTGAYLDSLRRVARQAVEVVAGERDEVEATPVAPDADGPAELAALASLRDVSVGGEDETVEAASTDTGRSEASATASADQSSSDGTTDADIESDATTADASAGSDTGTDAALDATADSPGDFEAGEFDIDDDERAEIEDEYSTEFQSGTDVDDPGEADIEPETPPEEAAAPTNGAERSSDVATVDTASVDADESADDRDGDATEPAVDAAADEPASADDTAEGSADDAPADGLPADTSLEDAVVGAMRDLDDGDGAATDAVVDSVVDTYGVDPDEVEDAVQEALMDGLCYEPQDGVLKPI